ncbi:MAG: hypothetical protein FJ318_04725 [SAR202 cluster bacterium]|nr:hypothetical protein [SAR202 cluster bacterium]
MTTQPTTSRIGEVTQASIERLTAQCHALYGAPPLGTLVRAGNVYAVVSGVTTQPLDPTRPVIARGAGAADEAEIYRENPQLEQLLRTDVSLTVVAHAEGDAVRAYLPALPPRIHTFVHVCSPGEVRAVFAAPEFLRTLLQSREPWADDVAAATLRQAARAHDEPRAFLQRVARVVGVALAGDTARLAAILRRLPLGTA